MPRRCAVLGSPIAHSLSPVLHRAAYDALGLDWEYDAHRVDDAGLAGFLAGLGPQWRGLSLTMPLKRVAVGFCTRVEDRARLVGAVNTLLLEGPGELHGLNTDVPGFVAAWRAAGVDRVMGTGRRARTATVLGAGATARSAVAALAEVGVREVTVVVRSRDLAAPVTELAEQLGLSARVCGLAEEWAFAEVDLLVSTLPAGVLVGDLAPIIDRLVTQAAAVCDVVYSPRVTPLLSSARRHARPAAEGFDLLLHQAARQVELMTGCAGAPLDAMRGAGLAELSRRETGT